MFVVCGNKCELYLPCLKRKLNLIGYSTDLIDWQLNKDKRNIFLMDVENTI